MIAVLHASHECPKFASVKSILHHWRIPYVVYGSGERQHRAKIWTFIKAVNELPDEHILFMDAWDVICLRGVDELMARYESIGHPWVVNAEMNCWPDRELARRYPECPTPYRYLNSGCMMVQREYARKWTLTVDINRIYDEPYAYSDQYWWALRHLENPGLLQLDNHCRLFQCLYLSRSAMQFSLWNATNTVTNTHPLIIHFNSNGNIDQLRGLLWK